MKLVRHVLESKGHNVYSINPDAPVLTALQAMADHNTGALVVIENDNLIGLISERDYARKVVLKGRLSKDTPVREIMEHRIICVSPAHSVEACMALMTEHRTRHLPVLENDKLSGLVSIGDVVKAIIEDQKFTIEQLEHYISGSP